jgi:hypothetical protein
MNDLFAKPDVFVEELAHSPWIVPGIPDESKLLTYLTTFNGPMYKVFSQDDLRLWRRWIEWLGYEGDTSSPKQFAGKAQAMHVLLSALRELAKGTQGHRRYRLTVPEGKSEKAVTAAIAELFERGDLRDLMRALRDPANGWVVPFDPGASPLILDLARGNNPMGRALDRWFESLGNQIGRQVVIRWIEAGCPIPGEVAPEQSATRPEPKWEANSLFVQQVGIGAVH